MPDFRIQVVVDPAKARRGIRQVEGSLNRVNQAADATRRLIGRAFAVGAIIAAAAASLRLVDSYTQLQNRLRTVTNSTEDLEFATRELFSIANRTRSAVGATAEVYTRVALAARDLGITQRETLSFTESLNKAVILSGASATEAQAGLIQLSQGLASGALRGDELRSVLEQLPVVADVIAKELGVTRGQLRELGAEGKIAATDVLRAFANAREELDERFGRTIPTIGQSLTILRNSATRLAGSLDRLIPISKTISLAITSAGVALSSLSKIFEGTRSAIGLLLEVTGNLIDKIPGVTDFFDEVGKGAKAAFNTVGDLVGELRSLGDEIVNLSRETGIRLGLLDQPDISVRGRLAPDRAQELQQLKQFTLFTNDLRDANDELTESLKNNATERKILAQVQALENKLGREFTGNERERARVLIETNFNLKEQQKVLDSLVNPVTEYQKQLKILGEISQGTAVDQRALREEQERLRLAILDVGTDRESGIERSVIRLRKSLSDAASIVENNLTRAFDLAKDPIEELRQTQEAVGILADRGLLTRQQERKVLEETNRLLEEAKIEELERLRTREAGVALALRDIQAQQQNLNSLTRGAINEVFNRSEKRNLEELQRFRDAAETLREQGLFDDEEVARELDRINQELLKTQKGPLAGFQRGVISIREQFTDVASLVENAVTNTFQGMEDALVDFVATGKLEFSDLISSINRDLARIAVRQGITQPLAQAIFGGSGGGSLGGSGNLLGGLLSFFGGGGGNFNPGSAGVAAFQGGGGFTVGGTPGVDRNLLSINGSPVARVSRGEDVTVSPGGGRNVNVNVTMNVNNPRDADSFNRSRSQIAARTGAEIQRQLERNG